MNNTQVSYSFLHKPQKPSYNPKDSIMGKLRKYAEASSQCTITGAKQIELCGCCGLFTYNNETIEIRLCDGFVRISGSGLCISHYYGGRMTISGKEILSVSFLGKVSADA